MDFHQRRALLRAAAGLCLLPSSLASIAQPKPATAPKPTPPAAMSLSAAINKAGRQRMLSQRIAKCHAQIALAVLPDRAFKVMNESIALFDRQLAELASFAPSPESKRVYGELARAWPGYRDVAQTAPSAETGARLQALNEEVLALAHAGTVELERVAGTPLGKLVNVSGRQRMLSQRAAKFYFFREWALPRPVDEDLRKARDEFQAGLELLREAPETNAAIKHQLLLVDSQWLFFDMALSTRKSTDGVARQNVATTSERILEVFETVTGLYEQLGAS